MIRNWLNSPYKIILAFLVFIFIVSVGFFILSGYSFHSTNAPGSSQPSANSSQGNNNTSTNNNKLVILEFGVQITLPSALIGTTYAVIKPDVPKNAQYTVPTMINLELKQYSTLVSKCLGVQSNDNYPYASLSKVSGKAPTADKQVLKQFDTFYIDKLTDGTNPQQCQNNDVSVQQAVNSLSKGLSDGLQTAFTGAKKI